MRGNTSALLNHEIFAHDERAPLPSQGLPSRVAGQHSGNELAWRQEVASRVQQHRARRRRPADPNALELDFSADPPHSFGATAPDCAMPPPPERFAEIIFNRNMAEQELGRQEPKIIRFPRTQRAYAPAVEEVTLDELEPAEQAQQTPRIMEAAEPEAFETQIVEHHVFNPEGVETEIFESRFFESTPVESYSPHTAALQGQQMELLPSFADIRLEPEEVRIDHDFEVIPRPAPLNQRFMSGLVDAGIVFIATGAFLLTFMESAEEMPQSRMTLVCMLAAGGIFWLLFQYIFLVFRRATPGMKMAHLELCTFAGTATSLFERQRRALASALSVCSIGLGFAWALVDEDRLSWHDRISGTHLRAAISTQPSAFTTEIFTEDIRSWKR
jgi:uncharacterized RDD family membrane protein YckC